VRFEVALGHLAVDFQHVIGDPVPGGRFVGIYAVMQLAAPKQGCIFAIVRLNKDFRPQLTPNFGCLRHTAYNSFGFATNQDWPYTCGRPDPVHRRLRLRPVVKPRPYALSMDWPIPVRWNDDFYETFAH
jgi:hypothetical protein